MNAPAKVDAFTVALVRVVVRARRQWTAGSFAAFIMDAADPLGAAIVEMLRWLSLGFFVRGEGACNTEARAFVVGAASLADLRIIVAGLADSDQGLAAIGELRETPGAGLLRRALCAPGPLVVLVAAGLRRVRRLDAEGSGLTGGVFGPYAVGHA